ncbi:MAG: hypothetical protein WKG07_28370 [Hymenobacter sp.]
MQALFSITSMPDFGHQEFMGYEFLRIGRDNPAELSRYIWSGVGAGLFISLAQLGLLLLFLGAGFLPAMLGKTDAATPQLLHEASLVLLFQSVSWLFSVSVTGLLFRALAPFGYYPRMAWWNLSGSILSSLAPVIASAARGPITRDGFCDGQRHRFVQHPHLRGLIPVAAPRKGAL